MNFEFELASLRARVLAQLPATTGLILVTAPGARADAAAVARHLAQALVVSGRGALLVEAASAPTGFAGYCENRLNSLAHALSSAPPSPGPGELEILGGTLSPDQIANPSLSAWLQSVDGLVVLLTADLERTADAIALGGIADVILLAVADGESRRNQLRAAIEDLRAAGIDPLGLVAAPARSRPGN